MKVHSNLDGLKNSIKQIGKLGEELGNLRKSIPGLIERVSDGASPEEMEKVSPFLKDSNELLDKSGKVSFEKTQELIKKYKEKHG